MIICFFTNIRNNPNTFNRYVKQDGEKGRLLKSDKGDTFFYGFLCYFFICWLNGVKRNLFRKGGKLHTYIILTLSMT
ncbi:hypothetical protein D0T84_07200 [Dysgonomonas sp. 521]|nr:hypothetical protein [Dysgonomonas sp. 521]